MTSLRPSIPHHLLQAECFYRTSRAQIASPFLRCKRRYYDSSSLGRPATDQPIIPDSLKETLQAHREVNRQSLIRRVPYTPKDGGDWIGMPQNLWNKKVRSRLGLSAAQRAAQASSAELGLESLKPASKKVRLDIRPHGAVALFKRLAKKSSARLAKREWTSENTQCPWLDYLESSGADGLSRLDNEIKALEDYMSQIPQEETAVDNIIEEVTEILRREDHPQPVLIGSRRTGLAMRHSNVDLLTILPDPDGLVEYRGPSPTRPKMAELQYERQEQISRLLRGTTTFSSVDFVRARIPTVTATHAATGLQLTFHCGTHLPSSSLEFIQTYHSEFPTLRPLLTTLRMILEQRNLFGLPHRTINTYTLTMMIIAALKLSEGTYSRTSPAEQLLHILHFYSTTNFRRYGISVDPPSLFRKRGHLRESSRRIEAEAPYIRGQVSIGKRSVALGSVMLCVQDPAKYMNDLGMGCFRTVEVQRVFGDVYADLRAAVEAWDGRWKGDASCSDIVGGDRDRDGGEVKDGELITARLIKGSEDKRQVSMLHFALGGDYDRFERMRDRIILGAGG